MEIKQSWTPDAGETLVIKCTGWEGDRARLPGRNRDKNDVPIVIIYNLGADFNLRTEQEKRNRVAAALKTLRVLVNEVVSDIGRMVGTKPQEAIMPHETGKQ